MGVLFDYFRAADREAARAVSLRSGGPLGTGDGSHGPAVDGVDAKGLDPMVVMGQLIAIVLDRPWTVDLVGSEVIWPEGPPPATGEEMAALPEDSPWNTGPWVEELGDSLRDALADVDDAALPGIASRWCRIEELHGLDEIAALDLVEDFVALARRAKAAGDGLYCWCCL